MVLGRMCWRCVRMEAALTEDLDEDVVVDHLDADVAVQGCSNQATCRIVSTSSRQVKDKHLAYQ